jgi:hypothetical protein
VAGGVRDLARRGPLPELPGRGRGGGAAAVLRGRTRARDRLFLLRPEIARDRYRVDVVLEPSRFLLELPAGVRDLVAIAEEPRADGLDALPGGGRYQLPGFIDDPSGNSGVN